MIGHYSISGPYWSFFKFAFLSPQSFLGNLKICVLFTGNDGKICELFVHWAKYKDESLKNVKRTNKVKIWINGAESKLSTT
jgi:hypothetical protein